MRIHSKNTVLRGSNEQEAHLAFFFLLQKSHYIHAIINVPESIQLERVEHDRIRDKSFANHRIGTRVF